MDTPETATVEVTQAELQLARHICDLFFLAELPDPHTAVATILARHRTRATRQDGLREALADHFPTGLRSQYARTAGGIPVSGGGIAVECKCGWSTLATDDDEARQQWANHVRAALSDSRTREESGSDEALKEQEFNRGVLIAVSTLINCWGRGTETEHLLAMINATPEMVEQMGFDNYDREPLLAALSASPDKEKGAGQ